MKRTIKFRAWDSEHKHMLTSREDIPVFYEADNGFHSGRLGENGWVEYILMQYTGVTDINGNEICEGDVVSIFDCRDKDYIAKYPFIDLHKMAANNRSIMGKILGNIYENPELLER